MEKVIIEAAEQSNRIIVPTIEEPQKLKNFLSNDMDLIFTDLNTYNTKIDLKKLTTKPICVIIGPEGDENTIMGLPVKKIKEYLSSL